MKSKTLYLRLAATGIRKNRKMYIPFFFASAGMMMIFYILAYLAGDDWVERQPGGVMTGAVLDMGWIVMTVFSAIFLFYTNSFLIKRRKTEFGLYNILGMGKTEIMKVLIVEDLIIFGAAFLAGIFLGILFSKLIEIAIISMLGGENKPDFSVNYLAILYDLCVYLALFGIILVSGMRQIRINNAVELFRSNDEGEKPPKANFVLAIAGAVLVISGYILENVVKHPVWGIVAFFGALALIIAGTYLLFIAGSVVFCRLLQKNKKYYYKKNHFVSVSQMSGRMRKNGAGLASICVLATVGLMVFSAVSGLYFGVENILDRKYPRDFHNLVVTEDSDYVDRYIDVLVKTAEEKGVKASNITTYRYFDTSVIEARYIDKKLVTSKTTDKMTVEEVNELYQSLPITYFYYIPVSDYNRVMEKNLSVNKGEAVILKFPAETKENTLDKIPVIGENHKEEYFDVTGTVDDFVVEDGDHLNEALSIQNGFYYRYVFLNDEDFETQFQRRFDEKGYRYVEAVQIFPEYYEVPHITLNYVGMDFDCTEEILDEIRSDAFSVNISGIEPDEDADTLSIWLAGCYEKDGKLYRPWSDVNGMGIICDGSEYRSLYGGLFFLGAMFAVIFGAAAVLIIYYKQITEGYEDRGRFVVLQKVGMSKSEIRKSINSQVLTLFFTPLLAAFVHVAFSFGMICRVLSLVGAMDMGFLTLVALGCFSVYAAVYTAVYKLTSGIYYRVVV